MRHVFPSDLVVIENEAAFGLRQTLAYLGEHGWSQHDSHRCIGHALWKNAGDYYLQAAYSLRDAIGTDQFTLWNDHPKRTFAHVRAALLEAIEIASRMPA
jgi:predicted ATPase